MDAAARIFFSPNIQSPSPIYLLDPLKNGRIMYTINFNDGLSLNSFNKKQNDKR